jgi:hypothetical protein
MSKRKNFDTVDFVPCPNGCGAKFKLRITDKRPKGMVQHLEDCGGAFTLPQKYKNILGTILKETKGH